METYVNGVKITPEKRQEMYLENLKSPVPGIDALWHKYTMTDEEFFKIHGYHK